MQSMIIGFWDVIKGECETYGYNELCVDDVFEDEERGLTFYLRVGKPVWEKVEGVYEWTKPIKEVEKISYLERSDLYRLNVDSGNVDIYRGPDWHILRSDEYWDEVGSAEMPDASAPMLKGNDATLLSDLINLIM